jgi:hypothetical protein
MCGNYTKDSSMTSREIVKRCIEFCNPPRIGVHFETDPIQGKIWNESDFAYSAYAVDPRFIPAAGQKEWVTEWGVKRSTINTSVGNWPAEYSIHIMSHDGGSSMIIGAAANQSALSGQPVAMKKHPWSPR